MTKKLLSQECISYCKAIERFNIRFSEVVCKLYIKIFEIVQMYDTSVQSIDSYYLSLCDNKKLGIIYSNDEGQTEYSIPIKWLDLSRGEVRELIKAQKEEQKKKKQKRKQ